MSYETSPILNRIKILKGWKNPIFPTKTLNYSREMLLWFKVYLFLKVYLWCQNIRLLTCEVRVSETHHKILYLSISKHIPKKKNVKSKWKTKSFLQNLKSPLVKTQNKKARFLLYRDLKTLKKNSEFFFNTQRRKKISKTWISKSRQSSWTNFSQLLYKRRIFQLKQQVLLWRKKQKLGFDNKDFVKVKIQPLTTTLTKHQDWRKKKQKSICGLLIKFQKDLLFLDKFLNKFSLQNVNTSKKSFQKLNAQLRKEYQTRIVFLDKIEKFYFLCFEEEEKKNETPSLLISDLPLFAANLYQKKTNRQVTRLLNFLKKQWAFFQKKIIFRLSKNKNLSLNKENFWKKTFLYFLTSSVRNITVQKYKTEPFFFSQSYSILFSRHFLSLLLSSKILSFKRSAKLRGVQMFKFLRFEQKKQLHDYKRDFFSQETDFEKDNTVSNDIIKAKAQQLAYRLSFRYNYRNHLALTSDLKLKYLVADLIKEYFSVGMDVKLVWPLKQFKNLKFYRLIFPAYKQFGLKKKTGPWDLNKSLRVHNKKYFYMGQNTNRLQMHDQTLFSIKKMETYKKLDPQLLLWKPIKNKDQPSSKSLTTLWASHGLEKNQSLSLVNEKTTPPILKNLSRVWQKKLKKKNKYLVLKKKVIQAQSEKRLFWASKQTFISNLTVTLTLFAKYLEVQPLADHLAKIIGETKKHALTLKVIKNVLRTLHFKRGIGYRIALLGRINGAKKSRTLYLKKLNRNRSRQTFSKNVNFAMSQARATIGAFGVKVWVYF